MSFKRERSHMCGCFVFNAVQETKCSHLEGIKGDGRTFGEPREGCCQVRIMPVQLKSGPPQCLHWKKLQSQEGTRYKIHRYQLNKYAGMKNILFGLFLFCFIKFNLLNNLKGMSSKVLTKSRF